MKTITEFENWYKKAQKNKDEQLPFVWELMRSPYTEYHYSLIISENTSNEFRGNLWHRFNEHHEEAEHFYSQNWTITKILISTPIFFSAWEKSPTKRKER